MKLSLVMSTLIILSLVLEIFALSFITLFVWYVHDSLI